jgi:hypothetical protein
MKQGKANSLCTLHPDLLKFVIYLLSPEVPPIGLLPSEEVNPSLGYCGISLLIFNFSHFSTIQIVDHFKFPLFFLYIPAFSVSPCYSFLLLLSFTFSEIFSSLSIFFAMYDIGFYSFSPPPPPRVRGGGGGGIDSI